MWVHERHSRILSLLQQHQRLTTEAFAAALGVSKETIRRDLIELEEDGKLARVHGGAIPASAVGTAGTPVEPGYRERARLHAEQKQAIAREAAALVERGMSCFIDAGSTTHALAQQLLRRSGFQVVTNSLEIAGTLARQPGIDVMLLGGRLEGELPATAGDVTVAEIARLRLDLVMFSPVAFDPVHGAMDYLWSEAAIARTMVAHARTRVLLADGSKLGAHSRVQICGADAVDVLVTDAGADAAVCADLRAAGVKTVVLAG